MTIGSTVTADYVYDGLERLAIRTTQNMTPAGTTHYVYDLAGRLIVEADDTGQTLREYVWLNEMPLAVVADVDTMSPQLWFVHADHLDRPVRMTDGSQAVVWDAVYRPFGQAVSITGSASNNLRFPGQYFLLESGLHYNWHRHYDPTTGRYLQAEGLRFIDVPSLYQYALSSPLMFFDSNGGMAVRFPDGGINPGFGHREPPESIGGGGLLRLPNYAPVQRGLPPQGMRPPVENPELCRIGPASRPSEARQEGVSLWDVKGGEWRWNPGDRYHNPHWDYNPWTVPNSPWQNMPATPNMPVLK